MVNRRSFLVINPAAISTIGQCLFPASTDAATQSDMLALSQIVPTLALRQSRLKFSRVTHEDGFNRLIAFGFSQQLKRTFRRRAFRELTSLYHPQHHVFPATICTLRFQVLLQPWTPFNHHGHLRPAHPSKSTSSGHQDHRNGAFTSRSKPRSKLRSEIQLFSRCWEQNDGDE